MNAEETEEFTRRMVYIATRLSEGAKQKTIAEEIGVSVSRANQLCHRAVRFMSDDGVMNTWVTWTPETQAREFGLI